MKFGIPISASLHGLAIFGGIFLFSGEIKPTIDGRVIPVEIISVAEQTNIRATLKAKKPDDIKEPDAPMRLENPLENVEEVAPDIVTPAAEAAEAADAEPEKAADALAPKDADEALPVPEEEIDTPKEPEKPAFDPNKLAALLDKKRRTAPEKNQQKTLQSETNHYEFAKIARAGSGEETALTLNEVDALQSKMYQCWRIPADAIDPESLIVRVRVTLSQAGDVLSSDLVDKAKISGSSNPYLKVAAQRALRAVSKCAPYDFLPSDKYNSWKELELNFRPEV